MRRSQTIVRAWRGRWNGRIGVLVQIAGSETRVADFEIVRDEKGRFVPGASANPAGRSPKVTEEAYLTAIREAVSPEDLKALMKEAVKIAREAGSWRGVVAVAELAAAYGLGKPVQRVIQQSGNVDAIMAILAGSVPAEVDEVIDAKPADGIALDNL